MGSHPFAVTGPLPGDYNRLIVLNWATEYPLLWPAKKRFPQPFTKFRAIYLYAVAPADLALFQKVLCAGLARTAANRSEHPC
eukprot:7379942-Prymnesium_polylepis.1